MKLPVYTLVATATLCFFIHVDASLADEFEVMQDVYGSCFGQNKMTDGVRDDCLSSSSIFNKSNGSIFLCEAHIVFDIVGLNADVTVIGKSASCKLHHEVQEPGANSYSGGSKYDAAIRQLPPGRPAGGVPARFYWATGNNSLKAKFCLDMVAYKGFSTCIDAPLMSE